MTAPITLAQPTGEPRGGVVVIHEAFGITDHIKDVCDRLAAAGWRAAAPHLFHRSGDPVFPYDDLTGAREVVSQLDGATVLADVDDAIAALELPPQGCGIVGFCMGGSLAFFAGAQRPLGAAVTFYGGAITAPRWSGIPALKDLAPSLRAAWLGLYGDLDAFISIADVEELRVATASSPVPTEVVRYADADHGFHCDARPGHYNAAAAADGWSRTLAWFDQHVK